MGNIQLPYGCEITVIAQEGLKNYYTSMLYRLMKVIAQEGLKTSILAQRTINSYVK